MRRILTALVGLPVLWVIIKLSSPLAWLLLMGVVAILASWEALTLLQRGGHRVYRTVGVLGSVAALVPFAQPGVDSALPVVATGAAAIVLGALVARDFTDAVDGALSTVFTVAFVGLSLGYSVCLRGMTGQMPAGPGFGNAPLEWRFGATRPDALGQDLLVLLLFVVWLGDAAAWFFGSRVGRTPLAPRISPRKTVEGAVAGIAASGLAGWIASLWFFQRLDAGHAVAIGLLAGMAGIVGDLAESVLKRAAKAKDSASLLPGHGGLLDRVDSLLLAAPILYYYYRIFLDGAI